MDEQIMQVAARIKELREIFGFSAKAIAEKLNLSELVYLGYEASGADIPISVIYNLALIYNVDTIEILSGISPKLNTISVVKSGEGLRVERFEGYQYENIAYKFMHRKMEPMIVLLNPSETKPALVSHKGQELNYCLEGEMIVYYDEKAVYLKEGDCVYFDSIHPHGQKAALPDKAAKFLTVINDDQFTKKSEEIKCLPQNTWTK
ncbi:MAG: XRE family transcriptional regulator [Oscillospiraceae bacterium]|nr:XRE family transcriptional regulator [Oscillospiraceae bacterium]